MTPFSSLITLNVGVLWIQMALNRTHTVYSGKFSREKIFANCWLFAKILSANVLFFVDTDRAIALIRENIIREMLYLARSRKFSRENFPLYGMYVNLE